MDQKYSKAIRLMHWISVLLILLVIISGFVMVNIDARDLKWQLYANHKSLGILIFIIFFIRVVIRMISRVPLLPIELSNFWQKAAKAGHYLLYVLMLVVPLCGISMSLFAGYHLNLFGVSFDIIRVVKDMNLASLFKVFHVKLAWAFTGLILIHILGAIKHLLIDKINLFKRII